MHDRELRIALKCQVDRACFAGEVASEKFREEVEIKKKKEKRIENPQ